VDGVAERLPPDAGVAALDERATRLAGRLLAEAGHRDIAYVGGRTDVETGAERLAGYEIAMRDAGLPVRVVDGDFRLEGGESAVAELLAGERVPSALIVANTS
jgi:LacI family transcriptional regulator